MSAEEASKTVPTVESEPAKAAGHREHRHPGDKPAPEESAQRHGKPEMSDIPEAPAGASREVRDLVEEAKHVQEVPYEPHSTEAHPK